MQNRTCSIEGCERRAKIRGWCARHYDAWRHHGDPLAVRRTMTTKPCAEADCDAPARSKSDKCNEHTFWDRVDRSGDCWLWTGSTFHYGHGQTHVMYEELGERQAHRVAYRLLVGPIPDGLVLDHLCRNPPCCNPAHLDPVTVGENTRRSPIAPSTINAAKTHCKHGHEFTPENTYVMPDGDRACVTCRKRRSAEYDARGRRPR
jgi:hypothetical protein